MQLSSAFCRSQQAFHEQRAAETTLDNVRRVATKAAAAWSLEADAAELRETRKEETQVIPGIAALADDRFEDEDDPMFSEPIDRDFRES